jgi:ATP-dependent helicase Lhr and Lhr-like helicase
VPLQGLALSAEVWERDVLPRRAGAYSAAWLDQLCASGELVWVGAGPLGRRSGKVALYFREDVRLAGPPPANAKIEAPQGEVHDSIRELLGRRPCFWIDLVEELDLALEELHNALWDLAWAGEVTNDAFAPLRAPRLRSVQSQQRRGRRFAARRASASHAVQGRWSLTSSLFENAPPAGPRLRAQAELMLERYGIVTRETVLAEGVPGGFSTLYGEMSNLEMLGTARRGYFVEGLGGAQFALPGAVERLRSLPHPEGTYKILAATDPANPYGAGISWPRREAGRRPSRTPGAYVLLRDGEPLLFVERGGRGILRLADIETEAFAEAVGEVATAANDGLLPRLAIERLDGEPVIGSGLEETLIAAGFHRQPRRLVASA